MRLQMALLGCLLPALLGRSAISQEHWSIIQAGTLIAAPGSPPLKEASIVIRNGTIVDVRAGFMVPGDLQHAAADRVDVVDLRKQYVMPGLIDAHVHLTAQLGPNFGFQRLTRSKEDAAIEGAQHARETLCAGFTTVRDMSALPEVIMAVRNGVRDGRIPGPTIIAAGAALSPTGGHADPRNGIRADLDFPLWNAAVCDGADGCRAMVRRQVQLGAGVIKVMVTGGVLDDSSAGLDQEFTDDELHAIVETAHTLGRKVAAHAIGPKGINAAVNAGVDSIEHGTYVNDAGIKAMRDRGVYLVPTLLAIRTVGVQAESDGYFPPAIRDKARHIALTNGANVKVAYSSGVKIAFGTDTGVSKHGENAAEFPLLVSAGMSPTDALKAATINAAELLGISRTTGTIASGKTADIIATDGDPLRDISELSRPVLVMHSGIVYKPNQQPCEAHPRP